MNIKIRNILIYFLSISFISFSNDKENVFRNIKINTDVKIKNIEEEILKKYMNKEITKETIFDLSNDIKKEYVKKGYITTKIKLSNANIYKGDISLLVDLGKINEIKIIPEDNQSKILSAFGEYKGVTPKIQNFDQALENMNVKGSLHLFEIVSTDKEGEYNILIREKKERKLGYLNIRLDSLNYDLKSLDTNFSINYTKSNLLNINDELNINFFSKFQLKNLENIYFSLNIANEIPYKEFKYKNTLNFSYDQNKLNLNNEKFNKNKVYSFNLESEINKNIYRYFDKKMDVFMKLGYENISSYIGNQKIFIQSGNNIKFKSGLKYTNSKNIILGEYNLDKKIKKDSKFNNSLSLKIETLDENITESILYNNKLVLDVGNYEIDLANENKIRGFEKVNSKSNWEIYMQNNFYLKNKTFIPNLGIDFGINKIDFLMGINIGFDYKIKNGKFSVNYSKALISKYEKENILKANFTYSI